MLAMYNIIVAMDLQAAKNGIKKCRSEITIQIKFANLFILTDPQIKRLADQVCQDRIGGDTFRKKLKEVGLLFGEYISTYASSHQINEVIIVGIPRGAVPFAEGIHQSLPLSRLFYTKKSDTQNPIFEKNLPTSHNVLFVLADTVVDTGSTAESSLRFMYENYPNSKIVLVSMIAAADGAFRLDQTFPNLTHITSKITTDVAWVQLNSAINHRIIPQIGDVGELASKT